jgi:hypothetical protein
VRKLGFKQIKTVFFSFSIKIKTFHTNANSGRRTILIHLHLRFQEGTKKMPTYKIRGIDVDFPYEAYESQLVYMDKVMQSLQEVAIN